MIVNCRINDNVKHIVIWKSRKSSNMFNKNYNKFEEKEKEFNNFLDASGFAQSLKKRNIEVLGIINNLKWGYF